MKIKEVFSLFDKEKIKYCVLRNYKNIEKSRDIDILIKSEDRKKIERILKKFDLKKGADYGNYLSFKNKDKTLIFDFKVRCLPYDGFCYEKADKILEKRRKYLYFYILDEKNELLHLILHSIIDKKHFKEEYKKRIEELFEKNKHWLLDELKNRFGSAGGSVFLVIKEKKYDEAIKLKGKLMRKLFNLPGLYNYFIRTLIKIMRKNMK